MTRRLAPRSAPTMKRHGRIDFEALNELALQHLPEVLEELLELDLKVVGKEFQMLNPRRQDYEHGSFSVNSETGAWADFAEDDEKAKGGDICSLVAYIKVIEQVQAATLLNSFLEQTGTQPVKPQLPNRTSPGSMPNAEPNTKGDPGEPPELPRPQTHSSPAKRDETVPRLPIFPGRGSPTYYYYNDANGLPIAVVCRYPGKKFFQLTLSRNGSGGLAWLNKGPEAPCPIYGLERLAARPDTNVVICEGEKAADAAAVLFPDAVAVTTIGGAMSPAKSDFSVLRGRKVVVCPDNDEPGEKYKDAVIQLAHQAGAEVLSVLRYTKDHFGVDAQGKARDVPKGYDLADALAEGWTAARIEAAASVIWEDVVVSLMEPPVRPMSILAGQAMPTGKDKPTVLELCKRFVHIHFGGHLLHDGSGFRTYRNGHWPVLSQRVDVERAMVEHLGRSARPRHVVEMTNLLSMTYATHAAVLDSPKRLVCVQNGTLDPLTGELGPHRAEDNISNQLPIEWLPDAPCPLWLRTLDEIFAPDLDKSEKIALLQEFIGYCLIADTTMHKFLWMVGGGGNGKSLVLSIIEQLVGRENVSHAQIERLQDKYVRAELKGKLLNISSEMSAQATVSDGYLKQIVSGDTIEAERKFEPPFSFKPFVRLIGATNELPRLLDHSEGFFRRAIILTFNRRFSESEQDKSRPAALMAELSGILAWAVRGLQNLLGRGTFEMPSSSVQAIRQYQVESDPVEQFVDEFVVRSTSGDQVVGAQDLYHAFDDWQQVNGYRRMSAAKFKKRLEALGFEHRRSNSGRYWAMQYNPPETRFGTWSTRDAAASPVATTSSKAKYSV